MIDLDCRIKSGNDKKKICLIWIAGSKPGDDNKKTQPAMTCMQARGTPEVDFL